jgi:hypothetical protein
MEERREALQVLRQGPANTYYQREAQALEAGGRFAAQEPRVGWHGQPGPEWSDQCVGVEPPVPGDGLEWGRAIDET